MDYKAFGKLLNNVSIYYTYMGVSLSNDKIATYIVFHSFEENNVSAYRVNNLGHNFYKKMFL